MTMKANRVKSGAAAVAEGEQGFMLLGLIVAIAIILIFLGAAASEVAFSLRREREVESARRADQYVRAIRRFYLKNQHYPGSLEQLENTNNVRYLRKRYVDPLTGKADYRLILVGQNKTTVKGFFGEPLAGIASTGLGAAAGMQSSGVAGPTTATPGGAAGASDATNSGGAANSGSNTSTGTTTSASGAAGSTGQAGSSTTTGAFGSSFGSGLPGSVGPFMGVGSSASGSSIIVVNEQTTYETWEFLYDPRVEKLKAAAALNAGAGSVGAGALGQAPGALGSPTNGTNSTNSTGNNGGNTPNSGTPTPQP
jgi:type II secretory pathway pseudopilin PulG